MAIKKIKVNSRKDDELKEVVKEIKLLALLNHPNIIEYMGMYACID